MADEADLAEVHIEKSLQQSLLAQKALATQSKLPMGVCAFCEEEAAKNSSFCDTFCRDRYEVTQKQSKINGSYNGSDS